MEFGGLVAYRDREVLVGTTGEVEEAVLRIRVEVPLLVGLLVELEHLRRDLEILPRLFGCSAAVGREIGDAEEHRIHLWYLSATSPSTSRGMP